MAAITPCASLLSTQTNRAALAIPSRTESFKGNSVAGSFSLPSARTSASNSLKPVLKTRAAADAAEASAGSDVTYHFVIANAKFMLDEEEHFQEQLKERLRWLKEKGEEQNFWLVYEPAFLDNMPDVARRLQRPAVALVSTDGVWITFMKLRLDRVLRGEYTAATQEEALASQPIKADFPPPANWVAPYPKYEAGWWTPYVPQVPSTATA